MAGGHHLVAVFAVSVLAVQPVLVVPVSVPGQVGPVSVARSVLPVLVAAGTAAVVPPGAAGLTGSSTVLGLASWMPAALPLPVIQHYKSIEFLILWLHLLQ